MSISTKTTLTELSTLATIEGLSHIPFINIWQPLIAQKVVPMGSYGIVLPIYDEADVAGAGTEGTDYDTITTFQTTGNTITVAEQVAIIQLTKQARIQTVGDQVMEASRRLAEMINLKQASLIRTACNSWTQTTGVAGTAMAASNLEEALGYLNAANAPRPYNMIAGKELIYGPKGITTKIFGLSNNQYAIPAGNVVDSFSRTGLVMIVNGFNVYLDGKIVEDASNDMYAYFFSRDAVAWGNQEGGDFSITANEDASLRALELVATNYGGSAIYMNSYGVLGIFDVV